MADGGSGLSTQMTNQNGTSGSSTDERLHALETAQAVQAAAMAGAEATQAAVHAGNMATTTAMQAGNMATMMAGAAGLVVGMFLGLSICNIQRS